MRLNLKRLGLLAGTCARVFAKRASLTPQRVDLMLVVRGSRLTQQAIAHRLCVSHPVVSRMLTALEDMGLVVRTRDLDDERVRIPELTEAGYARLALCFPEPTTRGAQAIGEATWLGAWRDSLARLGIRVDGVARSLEPVSFAALAAWNLRYRYDVELRDRYDPL